MQNSQRNPWATDMQTSEIESRLLQDYLQMQLSPTPQKDIFHALGVSFITPRCPSEICAQKQCLHFFTILLTAICDRGWCLRLNASQNRDWCKKSRKSKNTSVVCGKCLKPLLLDFSSLPMVASRWMNTRAWSCDETSWKYRHLSCGILCTGRLRVLSKTWSIQWFLRFILIHIWFHIILGPASWIIWLWNGNLISSKIQFLHSFTQVRLKRIRHVSQTVYGKRNPAWTTCIQTFENLAWTHHESQKCNLKTCANKTFCCMFFLQNPQWFLPSFSSASRCGMLHPLFKNNSFLGCKSKFGSPFLSKGFVHSWWFRIKLSRHSWLLDAEFHLSICTRLALSEPVLLQCSSGGIRWHTLEVCRL